MGANFGLLEKLLGFGVICCLVGRFLGLDYSVGLAGLFVAYLVLWIQEKQSYWKKNGIPGPPPTFLFGNTRELKKLGVLACYDKWVQEYGGVFGIYMWTDKQIVVTDPVLLRKILVTDFKNFTDRRIRSRVMGEGSAGPKGIYDNTLVLLGSERWKNVRNTITPAFTAAKIRQMTPLLKESISILEDILTDLAEKKTPFDAKKLFLAFTMDIIAFVALASKVDAQLSPGNEVLGSLQEALKVLMTSTRTKVSSLFPYTSQQLDKYLQIRKGEDFFWNSVFKVIKERRTNPKMTNPDFLQLLVNASSGVTKEEEEEVDEDEYIDKVKGAQKVKLTDEEILAQCILFLVAGHETTAACLAFTTYAYAMHPDMQERVRQELLDKAGRDGEITWEQVQTTLAYLDGSVNESLRMYPPTTSIGRMSAENYYLTDKIMIPKDCIVNIPFYSMHYDDKHYPNAAEYNPERFLPEEKAKRNPLTFLPFGYGPRNCIGQRFGVIEVKYALAHILRKFKFVPTDKTEPEPLGVYTEVLLHSTKPIMLQVEKVE